MSEKYQIKFIKSEEVADKTSLFTFEKPPSFTYEAGQTIDLTLPQLEGKNIHTFSLVTEPSQKFLQIATRMRGSDYKNTLSTLKEGDLVEIEGPFGSFRLHNDEEKPAVFLVGGIGITPFVSMIRDVINAGKAHKLYLFYSNRQLKDSAFFEELNTITSSGEINLQFIPTMTDVREDDDWLGETGYIDWSMVKKYVLDTGKAIYYMAGPPTMVSAMRKMLEEASVDEDSIRFEEFSGY
ncbi:MAG: FAD-dependent oxidoreductase [Candidatus Paceibacterota bacterium]